MSSELIGALCIVVLLILLYTRVWVGITMLFVGLVGIVIILGWNPAMGILGTVPYRNVSNYTLAALPLFIMMGTVMELTGIGGELFYTAYKWLGHLRGGMAMATSIAAAVLGVVTDSMVAAITLGKIALPEMRKYKYSEALASGSIVAGASLASLIPPSMGFILFAMLTGESVGKLFIGAVIPGILLCFIILTVIEVQVLINPDIAPRGPSSTFKEKIVSLKFTWAAMLLIVVIIGGIYGGIFTPTESGAMGAFGAIVIGWATRRLSNKNLIKAILDTSQMTAMIVLMTAGAFVFAAMMTVSKLNFALSDFVVGLEVSKYIIISIIVLIYMVLGMFSDILACILLTVPILFPTIKALGFDPIWFGVLIVVIIELGFMTPPVGMNVFMFAAVTKVPIGTIFRGVIPFTIALLICVAFLIAFPEIVTFLPDTMK